MKVVLAIDGSDSSVAAAQLVRRLAEYQRLDLTALSVIQLPDVAMTFSNDLLYTDYIEDQEKLAKGHFERVAAIFDDLTESQLSFQHEMVRGHAGYEIVNYCSDKGVDLVVLGSKGHSTLDRIFLGSVSDYVATHASCSVMIARPQLADRIDGAPLQVMIAYDGSPQADVAVQQFESFSWPPTVNVELLLAVPVYHLRQHALSSVNVEIDSKRKADGIAAAEKTLKALREKHSSATYQVVDAVHVGESIVHSANEAKADLILMGDTGRSAIARMLLGSTSKYVLRHAAQSVWIVRRKNR